MAISIANSSTYDGGFLATHTMSSFTTTGTDPYLFTATFNKNPASDVSGSLTADGNNMTKIAENLFANVCSIQDWGIIPADGSQNISSSTPSFKEQAMIALNLNGVDQTTPYNSTTVSANNFGTTATASITGTSGSLLLVAIATQNDVTFTDSNCTVVEGFSATSGIGGCYVGQVTATGSSQTIGATLSAATNWRVLIVEIYAAASGGANVQKINIGDSWKDIDAIKINIGDSWKDVAAVKINIGDTWKDVF